MGEAGADAVELVRGDHCADAGAADEDRAVGFAPADRAAYSNGEVRVVDGFGAVGACVGDVVPLRAHAGDERVLEGIAAVVSGCYDAHGAPSVRRRPLGRTVISMLQTYAITPVWGRKAQGVTGALRITECHGWRTDATRILDGKDGNADGRRWDADWRGLWGFQVQIRSLFGIFVFLDYEIFRNENTYLVPMGGQPFGWLTGRAAMKRRMRRVSTESRESERLTLAALPARRPGTTRAQGTNGASRDGPSGSVREPLQTLAC